MSVEMLNGKYVITRDGDVPNDVFEQFAFSENKPFNQIIYGEYQSGKTTSLRLAEKRAKVYGLKTHFISCAVEQNIDVRLQTAAEDCGGKQIIFMDDLYNIQADKLDNLELVSEYGLADLCKRQDKLIVATGQGRLHSFVSPELRVKVGFNRLVPFTDFQVGVWSSFAGLDLSENQISQMRKISGGLPGVLSLVDKLGNDQEAVVESFEKRVSSDLRIVTAVMGLVPKVTEDVLGHVIKIIGEFKEGISLNTIRNIRNHLVEDGNFYWEDLAYRLPEGFSYLAAEYLRIIDPGMYLRTLIGLNEMYSSWKEKYQHSQYVRAAYWFMIEAKRYKVLSEQFEEIGDTDSDLLHWKEFGPGLSNMLYHGVNGQE